MTLALTQLGDLALDSLQIIDAEALADQRYPHCDPAAPVLVLGLTNVGQATKIATALLLVYPASQPCALLDDAGRRELTLGELTSQVALASGASLWITPLASPGEYAALQDVVARLRAPDGCPWDRELTWGKMRASVLEEAHELLDALDADDAGKVGEELGDLLLQVALLAQIATEEGRFRLPDVIARIVDKLIRRHPHVFGDVQVSGTDEVLANWETIKRAERAANGDAAQKRSPLAGIPKGLPALAQAEAYLDRMARLREVTAHNAPWMVLADLPADEALTPEILGEALFNLVAWARARGVESESALRMTNARYAARVAAEEWG
jgi:tetrapyrrole methylase family protein / MazG family protein